MSNLIIIEASEFYRADEARKNPTIVETLINGRLVTEIKKPVLSEKWQAVAVIIAGIAALSIGVFGALGLASAPAFVSVFGALPPVWSLWLGAIGGGCLGIGAIIFGAYNYYRITQFDNPRLLTQADQQFLMENLRIIKMDERGIIELNEQLPTGESAKKMLYQIGGEDYLVPQDNQSIFVQLFSKEGAIFLTTNKLLDQLNWLEDILNKKLGYEGSHLTYEVK